MSSVLECGGSGGSGLIGDWAVTDIVVVVIFLGCGICFSCINI